MYPPTHFIVTFFLAELFVKFGILTHNQALICATITVLIDLDHYIEYIIHSKSFNFKNAWNGASLHKFKYERSFIHHKNGVVIISLLLIPLFFINQTIFYLFLLAYYSHIFLDYANLNFFYDDGKIKEELFNFIVNISNFEVAVNIIFICALLPLVLL